MPFFARELAQVLAHLSAESSSSAVKRIANDREDTVCSYLPLQQLDHVIKGRLVLCVAVRLELLLLTSNQILDLN